MPLVELFPEAVLGTLQVRPPEAEKPGLPAQLGAAVSLDNAPLNLVRRVVEGDPDPEDGFNPLDNLLPGEELVATAFASARSRAEMDAIRERTRRENDARRILAEGPLNEFVASTLAAFVDPVNYIPLLGAAGRSMTAGRAAARGGLGVAATSAASEAVLQAAQETRTAAESAAAVIIGGALGVGIGGAIGASAGRRGRVLADAVDAQAAVMRAAEGPQSVSAAAAPRAVTFTPEETELVSSGKVAEFMSRLKGLVAPSLEMATSPFASARALGYQLFDSGLVTKGEVQGFAGAGSALSVRIKRYDALTADAVTLLDTKFSEYRKAGGALTRLKFYEEVGRAMRRADDSPIPQVREAASGLRGGVIEPLTKKAIELKLLPEGVHPTTAPSYFSRVYDREKILANLSAFQGVIARWLRRTIPIKEMASDAEYDDIAKSVVNKILKAPEDRVPFNIRIRPDVHAGPLKDRTLDIPDEDLVGYLKDNALDVMARFTKSMAADLEFHRMFVDQKGFESALQAIRDEAQALSKTVDSATGKPVYDENSARALLKRAEREIALADEAVARMRGLVGAVVDQRMRGLVRIGRTLRTFGFLTRLGSVLLSSIGDAGKIVMEEGLARTLGGVVADAGRGFRGIRLSKREAQLAGTALENISAARVNSILDIGERLSAESKMERVTNAAGQMFGKLTLLTYWNSALKGVTSHLVTDRMLSTIAKVAAGEDVSGRAAKKLAQARLRPEDIEAIAKEAAHWERDGDVILSANTEAWSNPRAVEAFRDALLRDVDNAVITPGLGDAPLWTSTEWGKTIFQFKRFGAAATQRILISGLQNRDMATLNGMLLMFSIGMLTTAVRDMLDAGEVKKRSVSAWIGEGIDRSGILATFVEMDALAAKMTGGQASIMAALAGRETERYRSRNWLGQLAGPTAGIVEDMRTAAMGLASGELTQDDLRKVRRLIPGQNLFYTRGLLNALEAETAESLGLPKKTK